MRNALVVEGTKSIADLVVRLLGRRGLRCTLAESRAAAFAALARSPNGFDLAYVDLRLPDGSGLDVVTEIRRSAPKLPVILATGAAGAVDAARAVVVLAKPFVLSAFDEAVDACLPLDVVVVSQ